MVHLLNVPKPLPHLGVAPLCPQSPLLVLALVMCGLMMVLLHPLLPLLSAQPVNQVLPPGPPSGCGAPLPVGPVVDSVADQLRALELLSCFMDLPEVEALRSRLVPSLRLSLLSLSSPPTGFLRKNWQTSVKDKKSYRLNFLSNG